MSNLLKPLKMKNLSLNNRLVMPPMVTSQAENDGRVSKELLDYYNEKSKGGYISLIIIEHGYVKNGQSTKNQISIAEDYFIEDLKKLADVIHNNGSKAVMQINHAGCIVAPSAVVNPRKLNDLAPRELTKNEINEIIESFKDAALRAKKAGFDGVEIHSAHGYLLNQFLSPLTNKRTDEYGGDILSRILMHLQIIRKIRNAVGNDYPLFLRLGVSDYIEGGISIEESKIAAQLFEMAGIDVLDVTGGLCGYEIPERNEQGYFSELSEAIKSVVSLPVILTGGITEPDVAEMLLEEGKADLIGVGRAIAKDSLWAKNSVEFLGQNTQKMVYNI
ncbi:MAG: oxidase [Bacillota bacterium]|nr:oxidase [Bacillota bacterium]